MSIKFALIGGDKRNILLSKELEKSGHKVVMFGFEKQNIKQSMSLIDAIDFADYIICAIPFSRDNISLNTPLSNEKIIISNFLNLVPKEKLIFTGAVNQKFSSYKNIIDIYKMKNMTEKSAIATSEGALKIAIENTDLSICDSSILVIGYGKIGSYLSKILKNLGATVEVISRSSNSINKAIDDGFKSYEPTELNNHLSGKHIIFNTAEKIQVNKKNIDLIDKDCIYIELASKPFGINYEDSINTNLKVIYGLSLPAIVSPKTIANVMFYEILKYIKEAKE